MPALTVVEMRLLIAASLLAAWLATRRRADLRVRREDWGYFVVLGLCVAAVQGSYYSSIARLGVGLAILLQYLAPALIVLWEALRGAKVRAHTAGAIAAAVAGTALLVGGVDAAALRARPLDWAVGFSAAVFFAFYVLYSKRGLSRYAPATVLLYTFLVAAAVWAFVAPPWRIVTAGYGPGLWAIFLVLGVCSTLLPFACFYAGLKRLPASEAGIMATLEPVVAVLAAGLFLGEALRAFQWVGAALVLLATVLASRTPERGARPGAPAAP